jgi:hypothetical protein
MARSKEAKANINSDHSLISFTSTNYDEITINYYGWSVWVGKTLKLVAGNPTYLGFIKVAPIF